MGMDSTADLIAAYEPPAGVNLRLLRVDATTATFDIDVDHERRGCGLARIAMHDLIELADECGVALSIWAEPDPDSCGPSQSQLMRFYRSCGFERRGYHGLMYRPADHGY